LTSPKETHVGNIRSIREELFQLIDGMDYCLDWKPEPELWSVREALYHLVDTPDGGMHHLIAGIISGTKEQFDLEPDINNMTEERLAADIDQMRQEVAAILDGLEKAVEAADDSDFGKSILAHLIARGRDDQRTAQQLLEGLFARHWKEHLGQIRELREGLGV
jgi:hypothetical protein